MQNLQVVRLGSHVLFVEVLKKKERGLWLRGVSDVLPSL